MSSSLAELQAEAASCQACRLHQSRTKVVFGIGSPRAGLLVVGEAPGRDEDQSGEPFVGRSGKLLDRLLLEEIGITRGDCYIANVVKCRPPENRNPLPDEVASCRPYLDSQIELLSPSVILTLGNFASRALLASSAGVTTLRGRTYSLGDVVVVPTYHPAAALRGGGGLVAQMRADFVRAKQALACEGDGHG